MADGFLSPDGDFFEKNENFHSETARRILGTDYSDTDPISELIRRGYLSLIEFRAPGGTKSTQPDLDYVIGKRAGTLTNPQKEWLQAYQNELTRHQQYTINMDRDGIFRDYELNEIMMYSVCGVCPLENTRRAWCEGRNVKEPADCRICDKIVPEPLKHR